MSRLPDVFCQMAVKLLAIVAAVFVLRFNSIVSITSVIVTYLLSE